jgi:AbiV family abortive infection protein
MLRVAMNLQLGQLVVAGEKIIENAARLSEEASILANAGRRSRAFFLYQISLEECAKAELIGAAYTSVLMGTSVALPEFRARLLRHSVKNRSNAYFLEPDAAERAAYEAGDHARAMEVFRERQVEFDRESNQLKNRALYVDLTESGPTDPAEEISERELVAIRARSARLLALMRHSVETLRWYNDHPEEAKQRLVAVTDLVEELGNSDTPVERGDFVERLRELARKLGKHRG